MSSALAPGQVLSLTIEKPAAGGRMIARTDGQVVLVDGAVPGERVSVRIERIGRGVAYAQTVAVEAASPDRRPFGDRACGGCLYAHIAYARQLKIKAMVIADAFARIGRVALPASVQVAASPPEGYRMRARLHVRGRRLGFFREGTHEVCDARATGQLLPATCDVLDRIAATLGQLPVDAVGEIEISENIDASERVVHFEMLQGGDRPTARVSSLGGVTGITVALDASGALQVVSGSVYLTDVIHIRDHAPLVIRHHALAFFQGNRFLLANLIAHVVDQVPAGSRTVDLYAGGGAFAVAAARLRQAHVTAVEGDRLAAEDLAANAASAGSMVVPIHESVELFTLAAPKGPDVIIVDPPRTGMSRLALQGIVTLGGARIVYVACDIATLARDARRIVDAGYDIRRVDAFDLFPNTPHVEVVVLFDRA